MTVRRVRLYDEPGAGHGPTTSWPASSPPSARAPASSRVTWVHSSTGVMLPDPGDRRCPGHRQRRPAAERAGAAVRGRGARPRPPTRPRRTSWAATSSSPARTSGCSAPAGTGIIWGRPDGLGTATPRSSRRSSARPTASAGRWATPGGFHSFEHRWALAEAFDLPSGDRGGPGGGPHPGAGRGAQGRPGGGPEGPAAHAARRRISRPASCAARSPATPPAQAVAQLAEANVLASTTPYTPSYLRFGPSIVNSESDVEAALSAVRAL